MFSIIVIIPDHFSEQLINYMLTSHDLETKIFRDENKDSKCSKKAKFVNSYSLSWTKLRAVMNSIVFQWKLHDCSWITLMCTLDSNVTIDHISCTSSSNSVLMMLDFQELLTARNTDIRQFWSFVQHAKLSRNGKLNWHQSNM